MGADKTSAFPVCSRTKRILLGCILKKLEQQSVELREEYVE
jgi:hypothetical protein